MKTTKKSFQYLIAGIAAALALTSCGKDEPAVAPNVLNGTWAGECLFDTDDSYYYRYTIVISGGSFTEDFVAYTNAACTTRHGLTATLNYSIVGYGDAIAGSQAQTLDYKFLSGQACLNGSCGAATGSAGTIYSSYFLKGDELKLSSGSASAATRPANLTETYRKQATN